MKRIVKSKDVPTFRIDLPESEDWVEAKTMLRLAERDRMNAGLVKTEINEETDEATPAIDTSRANVLRLMAYLVDWGGPGFMDDNGKVEPITEENVGGLDEETSTYILRKIRIRNPRIVPPKDRAAGETPGTNT